MRRLLGAGVTSLLLLLATAAAANAGETWCDTDPPVVIQTPGGNAVVVYIADGGPIEHLESLLHPTVTYTVQAADGGQATKVKLTVVIPDDAFGSHYSVSTEVWSGLARTGTLYAGRSGYSGQPLNLQFKLNVP